MKKVDVMQGPVSRSLRANEPKWGARYPGGSRYKPVCLDPQRIDCYVVFDTMRFVTMAHPAIKYGWHRFGRRIVVKGLMYGEAVESADTLNKLGPRLPRPKPLRKPKAHKAA